MRQKFPVKFLLSGVVKKETFATFDPDVTTPDGEAVKIGNSLLNPTFAASLGISQADWDTVQVDVNGTIGTFTK